MIYLSRKRQTAGNICLLVFLAFLVTLFSPVILGGNAEAAVTDIAVVNENGTVVTYDTPVDVKRVIGSQNQFSIDLYLLLMGSAPLTPTEFNLDLAGLSLGKVSLSDAVYVSSNIYGSVYNFVYNATYSGDLPFGLTANIYKDSGDTIYESIYLKLLDQVPIPGGLGDISFDAGGNANVAIDQLPPVVNGQVSIDLSANMLPSERVTISVPTATLAPVVNNTIVIDRGPISIRFPAGALSNAVQTAQAQSADVQIVVERVNSATINAAQQALGLSFAGEVYEIRLMAGSTQITTFNGMIRIELPYTGSNPNRATVVFRSGNTWIQLQTEIDAANGIAYGYTNHFTEFAVVEDNVAPAAPIMGTASQSTLDTNIAVGGSAEANATVKIFNNNTLKATVAADGAGNFAANIDLVRGNNTIYATAADKFGNTSGNSAAIVVNSMQTPDFKVFDVKKTKKGLYFSVDNIGNVNVKSVQYYVKNSKGKVVKSGTVTLVKYKKVKYYVYKKVKGKTRRYVRYRTVTQYVPKRIYRSGKFTSGTIVIDPKNKYGEINEANNTVRY